MAIRAVSIVFSFSISALSTHTDFIPDLAPAPGAAATTAAIIGLARGLGLTVIAEGVVRAVRDVKVAVPVVVRLEGTNVEQGRAMLKDSGLAIIPADDLSDAARKAVAALA